MATVSRRLTEKSLKKKGFKKRKGTKHDIYVYCLSGAETSVFTLISRSSQLIDLDNNLISDMAGQCKLSRKQFLRLARCPMKESEYRRILLEAGHISENLT